MRKKNSPSTGNASWTTKKTRPDERARRAQPAHRDRAHVELRARAMAAAAMAQRTPTTDKCWEVLMIDRTHNAGVLWPPPIKRKIGAVFCDRGRKCTEAVVHLWEHDSAAIVRRMSHKHWHRYGTGSANRRQPCTTLGEP